MFHACIWCGPKDNALVLRCMIEKKPIINSPSYCTDSIRKRRNICLFKYVHGYLLTSLFKGTLLLKPKRKALKIRKCGTHIQ